MLYSYNIPEAKTCIRGTLRYAGFPEFIKTLVDCGFLSEEPQDYLKEAGPWNQALQKITGASSTSESDLIAAISTKTDQFRDEDQKATLVAGLRWCKWQQTLIKRWVADD